MNGDEPPDEGVLGARRRFALALAERTHHGGDEIRGYPLGRIEVLEQSSYTGLVQLGLGRRDLDDGAEGLSIEP